MVLCKDGFVVSTKFVTDEETRYKSESEGFVKSDFEAIIAHRDTGYSEGY